MKIVKENKVDVKELVTALKNGAVLILPTDTVYGLVCDSTNEKAVEKIFEIKKRDKSKTLPVFVNGIKMAEEYAVIDGTQREFLGKNWPGAVTVVLHGKKGLSPLVYKDGTIALRQSNYKLVIDIMELLGKPMAQTSANISGWPALIKISEIIKTFSETAIQPDIIIDAGDLPKNTSSKIVDLSKGKEEVLRY